MSDASKRRSLQIYQIVDGYCYNSDTLFLWHFARKFVCDGLKVLDVGSGSGVLGLLIARDNDIKLTQVEKVRLYAFLNSKNASANSIESNVVCGDFLELKCSHKFDIIVSNPPFYNPNILPSKNMLKVYARISSNMLLDPMIKQSKRLLTNCGRLIMCYGANETHRLFSILGKHGFTVEVARFVHSRSTKKASTVIVSARINTKSQILIMPPLITHTESNTVCNTDEVKQVYSESNVHSIRCAQNPYSPAKN